MGMLVAEREGHVGVPAALYAPERETLRMPERSVRAVYVYMRSLYEEEREADLDFPFDSLSRAIIY